MEGPCQPNARRAPRIASEGVTERKAQLVDDIEVHRGYGNVFADLGLADAERLKVKTGLIVEIRRVCPVGVSHSKRLQS